MVRIIAFVVLLMSVQMGYALGWPRFVAPTREVLEQVVETDGCSAGMVKVRNQLVINVKEKLCRTNFCPADWVWVAQSDGKCRSAGSVLQLKDVVISHVKDGEGETDHSVITAKYGEGLSFTMTTEEGMGWYCAMDEDGVTLMCANDR